MKTPFPTGILLLAAMFGASISTPEKVSAQTPKIIADYFMGDYKDVNSPFGTRDSGLHKGIDIKIKNVPLSTPSSTGTWDATYFSGMNGGFGNVVVLTNANETFMYCHLSDETETLYPGKKMRKVSFPDKVAVSGNTGRNPPYDPHLHLAWTNKKVTTPSDALKRDELSMNPLMSPTFANRKIIKPTFYTKALDPNNKNKRNVVPASSVIMVSTSGPDAITINDVNTVIIRGHSMDIKTVTMKFQGGENGESCFRVEKNTDIKHDTDVIKDNGLSHIGDGGKGDPDIAKIFDGYWSFNLKKALEAMKKQGLPEITSDKGFWKFEVEAETYGSATKDGQKARITLVVYKGEKPSEEDVNSIQEGIMEPLPTSGPGFFTTTEGGFGVPKVHKK